MMKLNFGFDLIIMKHSLVPHHLLVLMFLRFLPYLVHFTLMLYQLILSDSLFLLYMIFLHFKVLHDLILLLLFFLAKLVFQF
jgi:hypothetical protein